jgi:hypothetical protein
MVCDEVVNIVAALPPSNGQSTTKVRNEDANQSINLEIVSNTHMPGIVRGEHDLVPEQPQESR